MLARALLCSTIFECLPQHPAWFKEAGAEFELDWRLLAALSYQESLWEPLAESATGVRGLMKLTSKTAEELGIQDRLDPRSHPQNRWTGNWVGIACQAVEVFNGWASGDRYAVGATQRATSTTQAAPTRGSPADDRQCFEGILWILWAGAPWSEWPKR